MHLPIPAHLPQGVTYHSGLFGRSVAYVDCADGGHVKVSHASHGLTGWLVERFRSDVDMRASVASLFETQAEAETFAVRLVRIHSAVTA